MVKINTLSDADVVLLKEMADDYRKRKVGKAEDDNEQYPSEGPDTYVVKVPDDGIPAMVGEEPGFAEDCDFYRITRDNPPIMQKVCMLRRVFNLSTSELTADYALVTRTKAGLWVAPAGGGTYYKHLGRFLFSQALTTGDESVWGERTHEYGEGTSHDLRDAGTGTGTGSFGTEVKLHNFETHSAGVYEFYADAGDACLAYFDQWDGSVEHWVIIIPECP